MPRMPSSDRRLGAHLPLATGMVKAVERANEIGATTMQIWTDNPTAWRRRAAPPVEREAFAERVVQHDIRPVAIHAAYLCNLAGPDPDLFDRTIEILAGELRGAPTFRARFVNVHIGSHRGTGVATGTERVAEGVRRTLAEIDDGPDAAMLVLENSVGGGWGLGTTVDELAGIAEAVERAGVPRHRLGFCLDTAHAWGAGIDVAHPDAIDATLAEFDARIGLDRLVMVHLNDSRSELGSRADRHEHIGAGLIGPVGLGHLLRHPDLAHPAFILETPGMDAGYDAINLERARALLAGQPLAPLPPAAFELASSRARTAPA